MKATTALAHGRVNLIGEHTDYNLGYVLPTAIPQATEVTLRERGDPLVRARSRAPGGTLFETEYRLGAEARRGDWSDYLQGATWRLGCEGARLPGLDIEIRSDVPIGSGLSSSAALLVALLRALREAFDLELPDLRLAQLAQAVENSFVGARVGIMDPMAASLADRGTALFIDTKDLGWRKIALPSNTELLVISSGITHRNGAREGYNTRRAECEKACQALGIASLRELSEGDLETSAFRALPEPLGRRVRHVVTENARVLAAVAALERGDGDELGQLFSASHASMRDDYEMSVPEIDRLVQLATAQPGVLGARLTGGGFGGSIVALVARGRAAQAGQAIVREYEKHAETRAAILVP